ncbi:hypothetical protein G6F62_009276 [Rhizopus arrhizus]|nr:hypothetical protein G6F23_009388 [Rhizopus arrhizus]KAG0755758.1 hypothetical protein G6F24_011613 [Rhizopus arrhizus]KAG0781668.1 hypothetical protein G6F21_011524 [Rhizopus arrhizus]KAG0783199.1 hypothetical protein G6F22_008785 [Rhizopus arrhizus]KAG0805654.1 hypothetical protein G6F20_011732 [Rhizopus arrhizus]
MRFPWYLAIYYYLTDGSYPNGSSKVDKQKIRRHACKYYIHGESLVDKVTGKKILHDANVREVLIKLHEENHFSGRGLHRLAQQHYIYDRLSTTCNELARECPTCQMRARPVYKRSNLASPIKTPSKPFFMVGCDAVGPLEVTSQGNRYLLTGIDYLTRWPIAQAVPNINETTTCEFYYTQIVFLYGVPNYILTDRGSNFCSVYTKTFLMKLGCKSVTTTSYRPQTNGLCERLNQTLCATIAKLARDHNEVYQWDKYVNQALLALRTLVNDSSRFSPSQLLYGYQLLTPGTWQAPIRGYVEGEYELEVAKRVEFIQIELDKIRTKAREESDRAKLKQAIRYNRTVHPREYRVGEQVLLKEDVLSNKFADKWSGPYVVVQVLRNGTYKLDGPRLGRIKGAVNGDSLKPFIESKHMVPDITTQTTLEHFRTWVDARESSGVSHPNRV